MSYGYAMVLLDLLGNQFHVVIRTPTFWIVWLKDTAATCMNTDEWVKEAVEDLIIDEDALELAFEGCRFSDLARVAIRRGDNSFLAKRVAKRKGTIDMEMYNMLLNQDSWYLPFPTE